MNGISADSKQGLEVNVLGLTGIGKAPAQPGSSGRKGRGKKGSKNRDQPKISVISSSSSECLVKIQDGAQQIASNTGLVQLGNVHDPPLLSIPDTAADNETISRLLGSQGAALLDLGSADNVNIASIDFIQGNVEFSHESPSIEALSSVSASNPPTSNTGDDDGETLPSHGELPGPVQLSAQSTANSPTRTDRCGGDKNILEGLSQEELSTRSPLSLDVNITKHDKVDKCVSAAELLNDMSQTISQSRNNKKCSDIVKFVSSTTATALKSTDSSKTRTSSQSAVSPQSITAVVSPAATVSNPASDSGNIESAASSLSPVILGKNSEANNSSTPDTITCINVGSDPTGDSLLLNIAQVNSSNNASSSANSSSSETNHVGSADPQSSVNPLTYIITSRDKTTGVTQKFRLTVDPESVMYIPVMGMGGEGEGSGNDEVSLIACESTTPSKDRMEGIVEGEAVAVNGTLPILLQGSSMTTVPVEAKDCLATIPGEMISSTLILDGNAVTASRENGGGDDDEEEGDGKTKSVAWSRKTSQRKKEAQEVLVCDHPGCGTTIIGKSKYRIHKLSHNDNRPYKCPREDCDWSFPSQYKLRRHISGHTGAKPFVCGMENCGKQFSTIYNLKMHLNSHFRHTVEVCDYEGCGKIFNSVPLLKIHKRKHFEEQRLKCEFPGCTKTFTTSSALGSHQRVHVKDATNYPCPFENCNKVYDKACRLKLHMRSHTGERPFKCTFEGCDWAFTCIQKLTRHLVRHTGERKYKCKFEGCKKLFTRLEHLKSHEVFHSGEKPYACKEEGCNARFAARSSLYMHLKRHQQGKPMREKLLFSCPLDGCDMSFASKLGLKSHIIKGHGVPLPFTGGAADFELIGLGNDQLHSTQTDPQASQAVLQISNSQPGISLPTITLPTISTDLMTSSLLQSALIPPNSTAISLNSLTSSRDEAASILASGLLQNQFLLSPSTASAIPINLTTTAAKDQDADAVATPASAVVSIATPSSILTMPSSALTVPVSSSSMVTTPSLSTSLSLAIPPLSSASPLTSVQSSCLVMPSSSSPLVCTSQTTPSTSLATATATPTAAATPKVYQEHHSGCARTDYRAVTAKHPLPPEALEHLRKGDTTDVDSLAQSESSVSSDSSLQASFIPLNMMTSASLTLRDPATGTRYIQTQLLQDDPPDMPDMGFHLSSHDSADQSPLNTSLSVSAMLDETGSDHNSDPDFMSSDVVIAEDMVTGFRESTINLQDLE
ncbi:uncharacterized protein [Diadema antillarum]|uniref:uncharacterized protein n=1 Tax=Diadema antillarum TaxID=105358 RepID=UPI003A8C60A9